jgi:hypothetical protein
METRVKTIGKSGQLSLGKQYAGQTVLIESPEPGVWHIKTAKVIPEKELWMHQAAKSKIDEAIRWAETHPRQETDLDALEKMILERFKEGGH